MFKSIEDWYSSVCNDDWEHTFGISITTIDNPGWAVSIDLTDTPLESHGFTSVVREVNEGNWVNCRIQNCKFEGFGGIHNLNDILDMFTAWASGIERD